MLHPDQEDGVPNQGFTTEEWRGTRRDFLKATAAVGGAWAAAQLLTACGDGANFDVVAEAQPPQPDPTAVLPEVRLVTQGRIEAEANPQIYIRDCENPLADQSFGNNVVLVRLNSSEPGLGEEYSPVLYEALHGDVSKLNLVAPVRKDEDGWYFDWPYSQDDHAALFLVTERDHRGSPTRLAAIAQERSATPMRFSVKDNLALPPNQKQKIGHCMGE
jgi:hypothetical protein